MDIAVVYSVQACQSHKCREGKLIPSMRAQEFTYRKGEALFYVRGYREIYGEKTHRLMDICGDVGVSNMLSSEWERGVD
jgi:hypothetical protein